VVKAGAPDAQDKVTLEAKKVLKGKDPGKLTVNLAACALEEHVKTLRGAFQKIGDEPVLFFDTKDEAGEDAGYLHLRGTWLRLDRAAGGWDLKEIDSRMAGTWAGGTDMLLLVVESIIADPDNADVPTKVGVAWKSSAKAGKIDGRVCDLQAVDLKGDGGLSLFVAAESGDRMFRYDAAKKAMQDVSEVQRLKTKSRLAAWGDFDGDGGLDLASWDGKALSLWKSGKDGALEAGPAVPAEACKGGCLSLAVLDVGAGVRSGLLLGRAEVPGLVVPGAGGECTFRPLAKGRAAVDGLGGGGRCLVADFDGDGVADVLQLFEKGGIFYKGQGAGKFADGVACHVAAGSDKAGAFVGDYDGDGRLDIVCPNETRPLVWRNFGDMKFMEVLGFCGSLAYIQKPGSFAGQTCDINNDGRQDLLLAYSELGPQLFFNRGYCCFGFCIQLTASFEEVVPDGDKGMQAARVGDFNADGAQDLALVLPNGELWVAWRDADEGRNLGVKLALPRGKGYAGPSSVTAWWTIGGAAGKSPERPMGTWAIVPGEEILIGAVEPGTCRLKWQSPDGQAHEKKIEVKDKPVRFALEP
jgi:hypothetical protein